MQSIFSGEFVQAFLDIHLQAWLLGDNNHLAKTMKPLMKWHRIFELILSVKLNAFSKRGLFNFNVNKMVRQKVLVKPPLKSNFYCELLFSYYHQQYMKLNRIFIQSYKTIIETIHK